MTIIIYKENLSIVHVQNNVRNAEEMFALISSEIANSIDSGETLYYTTILEELTMNEFLRRKTLTVDGVVDRIRTLAEIKELLTVEIKTRYASVCSGKDPLTNKPMYVDCIVGGVTYRMNAGKDAAEKMDSGVRIFERQGASVMPVIRDFHNVNHIDVPIADATSISVQQGADALGYWLQYGQMVDAIKSAATVGEVRAIDIAFLVNVEAE